MRKLLTVKQRVRMWLAERNLTQRALAGRLGMSEARLSLILSGKSTPSLDEGLRLSGLTGIPAKAFVRRAA